jgi:hypothetical protein
MLYTISAALWELEKDGYIPVRIFLKGLAMMDYLVNLLDTLISS